MIVIGVDVGSLRRAGGFSWASIDAKGGALVREGSDDPSDLAAFIVEQLNLQTQVAVAFESPLSIPVPDLEPQSWRKLGMARDGEGRRSWSAGAGTGALATGLVQLAWICSYIADKTSVRTTTQLTTFTSGSAQLLLTEAFVSADGKPEVVDGHQDRADALAAAKRLAELVANGAGSEHGDVTCYPSSAFNLAAAAALRAHLDIDPGEIGADLLVAKSRPSTQRSI